VDVVRHVADEAARDPRRGDERALDARPAEVARHVDDVDLRLLAVAALGHPELARERMDAESRGIAESRAERERLARERRAGCRLRGRRAFDGEPEYLAGVVRVAVVVDRPIGVERGTEADVGAELRALARLHRICADEE